MVRFNCPGCRVVLKAPDRHIGAAMPCPNCGRRLFVPGPLPAGAPASSGPRSRLPLLLGGAGALTLVAGLLVALVLTFLQPRRGGDPSAPQASADKPTTNSKGPADSGPRPPSADPADGRQYALLVGVRNYKKGELRSLKYTENDADALAQVLRDAGYKRVVEMTQAEAQRDAAADLDPTAQNIRNQLRALLEDRRPEDAVLVAFSGHGVQFKDDKGSYFCPMDAELADRTTLVSLAEVYKDLEGCPAGLRVLLVDACRADPQPSNKGVQKMDLDSVTRPQAERPPGGVAALFSCSEGQFSYESDDLRHGVFFHFLIEGLKGKAVNKRGEVTLERLASYVKDEVPDRVKDQEGPQARQVPHLVGDLSGSSALVRLDSGPIPPAPPEKPTPPVTKEEKPEEDITNAIGMKLKLIKAGKFLMGSPNGEDGRHDDEGPQHEVEITKAFYMGVYPVTKGQFAAFVKDDGYLTEAERANDNGILYAANIGTDSKIWKLCVKRESIEGL